MQQVTEKRLKLLGELNKLRNWGCDINCEPQYLSDDELSFQLHVKKHQLKEKREKDAVDKLLFSGLLVVKTVKEKYDIDVVKTMIDAYEQTHPNRSEEKNKELVQIKKLFNEIVENCDYDKLGIIFHMLKN